VQIKGQLDEMAKEYTRQYEYDFFLSRRGSVAEIAQEVADVLLENGYRVLVQDYDFESSESVIERMHDGVKNARDLVILFSSDYEQSPYTRKEFTSFEAQRLRNPEERHTILIRCEDVSPDGLLADVIYQDLVGVADPAERKRRIVAGAERKAQAAPPPPRPFIGLPPRIPSFTGREAELTLLDTILVHDKPAVVTQSVGRVAVRGLGGVGKTSLAIEYAYRYRNLYAGVCWCPAETRSGLVEALANVGDAIAGTSKEPNNEERARAALQRLTERRMPWLLIYDNATSPNEILEFLPSAGARVLITSRFLDWTGFADEVGLDLLPPEEALALLQNRAGLTDRIGGRTLAAALGYLPLALDHAAAYCKRTQVNFADYATRVSTLIANAPRDVTYPRSISATFDLAIDVAEERCSAAEEVMAFLSYCAPTRVPTYLLEQLADSERAIAVLAELSLIKHDPFEDGLPAITVHRLVQAVARHRAEAKGIHKVTIERISAAFKTPPPLPARRGVFSALRELTARMRIFVHERQLWRYQLQNMIRDYEHISERYDDLANRFDKAGEINKAKEFREKSKKFREAVARLRRNKGW
jgi:hypothetical protein